MKVNAKNLKSLILEVIEETEILQEAWDSGWPTSFEPIAEKIRSLTTKGKNAEDIISKYLMVEFRFRHLTPPKIGRKYRELLMDIAELVDEEDDTARKAAELMATGDYGFGKMPLRADRMRFAEIGAKDGAMAALRVLNKMIKSYNKRSKKFFEKNKDILTGRAWQYQRILKYFDGNISDDLNTRIASDISHNVDRIKPIVDFVNAGAGDDNTKRLASFYKTLMVRYKGFSQDEMVRDTIDWIEDQSFEINMTLCDDPEAADGAGCVLHQFDDGFFWYNVNANRCEVSGRRMNNCGAASDSDSILYNLMSNDKEGRPSWHVMVEYNPHQNEIAQILGNSNKLPKKEYWGKIKAFLEAIPTAWEHNNTQKFTAYTGTAIPTDLGHNSQPRVSEYAWQHANVDSDAVEEFLLAIGASSESTSLKEMVDRIERGDFNSRLFRTGEHGPEKTDLKFVFDGDTDAYLDWDVSLELTLSSELSNDSGRKRFWSGSTDRVSYFVNEKICELLGDDCDVYKKLFPTRKNAVRVSWIQNLGLVLQFSIPVLSIFLTDDEDIASLVALMEKVKEGFTEEVASEIINRLVIDIESPAEETAPAVNENKRATKLDGKFLTSMIKEVLDEGTHKQNKTKRSTQK